MMTLTLAALVGIGGTLCIDLWALLLGRVFGVPSLDYCLLGRWTLHMPAGRLIHDGIGRSAPRKGECVAGWVAHYTIGISFGILFVLIVGGSWLDRPTVVPALLFGLVTVLVPFLTMQPAFGMGVAASRTPHPWRARFKSTATHAVLGLGMYLAAFLLAAA